MVDAAGAGLRIARAREAGILAEAGYAMLKAGPHGSPFRPQAVSMAEVEGASASAFGKKAQVKGGRLIV